MKGKQSFDRLVDFAMFTFGPFPFIFIYLCDVAISWDMEAYDLQFIFKLTRLSIEGTLRNKFLRSLLPFWSSALPTLPVTAPPRKDASHTDDTPEGRTRHHRSSRMDPRKILLIIAIMYDFSSTFSFIWLCISVWPV